MNANTISNALAGNNPTGASATLVNPTGASEFINPNGTPLVLEVPSTAAQGVDLGLLSGINEADGLWFADGRPFRIRISGQAQPAQASETLTLTLMLVKGQTSVDQIGINILQVSQALSAAVPFYSNFSLEVELMWDSASQTLNGLSRGQIGGTLIDLAAITFTNVGSLAFSLVPKLSAAANQGNVVLTQFYADAL